MKNISAVRAIRIINSMTKLGANPHQFIASLSDDSLSDLLIALTDFNTAIRIRGFVSFVVITVIQSRIDADELCEEISKILEKSS